MSNTMGDDNIEEPNKKRKSKWTTLYSTITRAQAEQRLNILLHEIPVMLVDKMLATGMQNLKTDVDAMKEKIYERLLEFIEAEGYPTEANAEFKEANISELVYGILAPIIRDIRHKTRSTIQLSREKEIISIDNATGGQEEFVVMDRISVTERKFVLIVEAKRTSTGEGIKQCLLTMKDAWENNGIKYGFLYGFVTTGEDWQMIRYDGVSFKKARKIVVLFEGMDQEKELWMKEYSVVVDCLYFALNNGGIITKDVVVA